MEDMGYKNYAKILNAKDYGVPQNRERVYTLSILKTEDDPEPTYVFPAPEPLTKKLKDVLEPDVDEKYYIKDATSLTAGAEFDTINGGAIGKMHDISRRAYHTDGIAPAMHTCPGGNTEPKITLPGAYGREFGSKGKIENPNGVQSTLQAAMGEGGGNIPLVPIKTATKTGYDLAQDGDGIDLAYPDSTTRRGRVGHGVAKTLATSDNQGCLDGTRIRKLTPKECWRLMGFTDEDFAKAEKVNSNTQLYKQAGNSIVVDVLVRILQMTNIGKEKE
jgi:DNA (cytosine-5)-methyltransferase 1